MTPEEEQIIMAETREQNVAADEQEQLRNQQMQDDAVANEQVRRQEIEQRQEEARALRRRKREEQMAAQSNTHALDTSEIKDEQRDVSAIRDITIGEKKKLMAKSVEVADDFLAPTGETTYNPGSYSQLGGSYFSKSEEGKKQRETVKQKAQEFQQTPVFRALAGAVAYKGSLQEKQRVETGSYRGWEKRDTGGFFSGMAKSKVKKGESESYGMSTGVRYAIPGVKGKKGAKDNDPQAINLLGGFGVKKSGNKEIRQSQGKGFPVANNFGFDNVTSPFARYADSYVAPAKDTPYNPGSYSILGAGYHTDPEKKKSVIAEAVAFSASPVGTSLAIAHAQKLKMDVKNWGKPPMVDLWLGGMTSATERKDPRDVGFYGVSGGIRYAIPQVGEREGKVAPYRDPRAINIEGGFGVTKNKGLAPRGKGFPKEWSAETFAPYAPPARELGTIPEKYKIKVETPPDSFIPTRTVEDASGKLLGVIPKLPEREESPAARRKRVIREINVGSGTAEEKKKAISIADANYVKEQPKYEARKQKEKFEKKHTVVIGGINYTDEIQRIYQEKGLTKEERSVKIDAFIDSKQRQFKTGKYAEKPSGKHQPTPEEIEKVKKEKEAKIYAENIAKGWKPILNPKTKETKGWLQKRQLISMKSAAKTEDYEERVTSGKIPIHDPYSGSVTGWTTKEKQEKEAELIRRASRPVPELSLFNELIRTTKKQARAEIAAEESAKKAKAVLDAREHKLLQEELSKQAARAENKRAGEEANFAKEMTDMWTGFHKERTKESIKGVKSILASERSVDTAMETVQRKRIDERGREHKEEIPIYFPGVTPEQRKEKVWKEGASPYDIMKAKVTGNQTPWEEKPKQDKWYDKNSFLKMHAKAIGGAKEDLLLGIKHRADTAKGQRSFLYGGGLQPTSPSTNEPLGHFPRKSGKPARAPGNLINHTELKFFGSPLSRGRPVRGRTRRARRKIVVANQKRAKKLRAAGKGSFFEKMFG